MKRYFINPELKKSSAVLLMLMASFMVFTLSILKVHHINMKDDYIKCLGAVSSRIIEKNPEFEKEIISAVTREISDEEAMRGRALLAEYGLSKNLEDELFPYINSTIFKNYHSISLIFAVITAVLFLLNYFQYRFFYNRIRKLTLGAKRFVEGHYDVFISENGEGDFSKLAHAFNSMREVVGNNLKELRKDKQFLVDLLSDISHQLKTPLSSMLVYNDILLKKDLPREQREAFLLSNKNQLHRIEWMVRSLLKLARLDAKAVEFEKENQSLNETIQEAIDALQGKALEADVNMNFTDEYEVFFEHDRLWLEEALINIIKNCIEHTPVGGSITIELMENPIYRRIIVRDTGEGIREEDIPHIFKRFYKTACSKKSDSIGIGLALTKSIIVEHKGVIEVQSEVGTGTKFVITFIKY